MLRRQFAGFAGFKASNSAGSAIAEWRLQTISVEPTLLRSSVPSVLSPRLLQRRRAPDSASLAAAAPGDGAATAERHRATVGRVDVTCRCGRMCCAHPPGRWTSACQQAWSGRQMGLPSLLPLPTPSLQVKRRPTPPQSHLARPPMCGPI
jgi:hypothetical protein